MSPGAGTVTTQLSLKFPSWVIPAIVTRPGDIQVTSNWGEGTTFTLLIPREKTTTSLAEDAITVATRLNSGQ